jgi:hypothetical protein
LNYTIQDEIFGLFDLLIDRAQAAAERGEKPAVVFAYMRRQAVRMRRAAYNGA